MVCQLAASFSSELQNAQGRRQQLEFHTMTVFLKQALGMKNTFLAGYQEIFYQISLLAYFVLKNIPMHFEVVQCEIFP